MKEEKISEIDLMKNEIDKYQVYKDEYGTAYICEKIGKKYVAIKVNSDKFGYVLTKIYYSLSSKQIRPETISTITNYVNMKALYNSETNSLTNRIRQTKHTIYYDLNNDSGEMVKINSKNCKIIISKKIFFSRNNNMTEQLRPDFAVEISNYLKLIKKHFIFKREDDLIVFCIYLVMCFVKDVSHPILLLHGEKGSGKSTFMKMVKSLVDPCKVNLKTLPRSSGDLAITLHKNYYTCLDNIEKISTEKSNMLCQSVTGGAFETRKLYTDDDTVILNLKRCCAMNGVDMVIEKSDLLDRAIILELKRINKKTRKTDEELFKELYKDIPKILGCCFKIISKVLGYINDIELEEYERLADFTKWGYAIAETTGIGGQRFLDAYRNNQKVNNRELLLKNPVAQALFELMKTKSKWTGSVTDLLKQLHKIAHFKNIRTKSRLWAKQSHVLSRRLKEIKSNLSDEGITFKIVNKGTHKQITIYNSNAKEEKEKQNIDSDDDI